MREEALPDALDQCRPRLAEGAAPLVGEQGVHDAAVLAAPLADDEPQADEAVDEAFFARRIAAAAGLRRDLLKLDATTDAWRVVHAEGDGLSGLVVDRYGDLVVVEFFSAGAFRDREWIFAALREQFPGCRFYSFAEEHVRKQESFDFRAPPAPEPRL